MDEGKELAALRAQVRIHAQILDALAHTHKRPDWQASVGHWVSRVSDAVFWLQYFPYCFLQCVNVSPSLPSGAYNPKKACLNVLTMLGGVVNAALVFWVVVVREGRDDVFALGVSYVAWFASVAVLHATKERARRLGGAAFNSAADRHSAELFRFFGVKVKQVSGTGTAFPLIMMVGLLPGILAGFLANWIWTARYDIQCSRGWTRATPGVHSCGTRSPGFSGSAELCCKFPDERLEVFTFIAF